MGIYVLPQYKQHPTAISLMPGGMSETEFDAFVEDVKERGILFPATLYEGMVLDGWHRYRAAQITGDSLEFVTYTGKDPAGYIASCNVQRRKLSSLQRALVAARLYRDHGMTQRDACKRLGLSLESVSLVLKAIDSHNSKLIKRLESDSDFNRQELKEELSVLGLLTAPKAKPPESADTTGESTDGLDEVLGKPDKLPKALKKLSPEDLYHAFSDLSKAEKIEFMGFSWALMHKACPSAFVDMPSLPVEDAVMVKPKRAKRPAKELTPEAALEEACTADTGGLSPYTLDPLIDDLCNDNESLL